ncbi:histone-lysine N-methyltransferase NSD2 isoform X2 [Thrips palmi]|uniref:Histone-lysine N-methyltransferase NSD2 isoform X2 n=1 Tax=Thrips palmi TaxID=161013 RepID=A0A6P8Y909_THRPL|nr:histone-lysine N-methyltransferase NSD2 isoform X2 [Thrips palmi]
MDVDIDAKIREGELNSDSSKIEEGEGDVSMNDSNSLNNSQSDEGDVLPKEDDMNTSTQCTTSSEKAIIDGDSEASGDLNNIDNANPNVNPDGSELKETSHADSNGAVEGHQTSESTVENSSAPASSKKRRRSSALQRLGVGSPEVINRSSGRTRKPKPDTEDFLPTDAVLGKSPKKVKKSIDIVPSPEPMTKPANGSLEDSVTEENGAEENGTEENGSSDLTNDLKAPVESVAVSEAVDGGPVVKYEPGDLLWGRLGHYPFWPCIIIHDPVEPIFYKKDGRGRLTYHVLFYGDNGKRSWVASTLVLQFLGLQDFERQAAAVTSDMKKKDPKFYPGFVIKPFLKAKWNIAVREAEDVMTLTRDERMDAFLETMPQRKGRKSKVFEDDQGADEKNVDASAKEGSAESELSQSPTPGKKKKLAPKPESPSTEKKKRGRPRKIQENPDELEAGTPEPVAKSTPGPGRGRKRKLQIDAETIQSSKDDPSFKIGSKRKRKKKKDKKAKEDKAFSIFSEKHLDRLRDDQPDWSEEDALKCLSLLWDQKDEEEKMDFIRLVASDDVSEEESESEDEEIEKEDDSEQDDTVEEEVATVQSANAAKESDDDDPILSILNKKINLFKGYRMERVCQGCEKPGKTVKCRGPCAGVFHIECARGADNCVGQFSLVEDAEIKPKKRGRKKKELALETNDVIETPKTKANSRHKKIYADEETDSDLDYADGEALPEVCDEEAVMRMILGNAAELPEVSFVNHSQSESEVEDEDNMEDNTELSDGPSSTNVANITDFRCGDCAVSRTPLCYACGQASVPSGEDSVRVRCSVAHCGKHYHIECLKVQWPQTIYNLNKGVVHNITCPQHVCHTCVSDNPRDNKGRFVHEKLVRCIRCPTSYHYGNYCVPAGSKILTATQIICPRHYEPPKKGNHHINASWCFICSVGGSLICCDLCPTSFHVDCLKIKPPTGDYICEDCETGRYPLYNEVLWVKLGHYRWWPALSLFPTEIPDNVENLPHRMGEFVVRFLGTNDHYWIERGRCFMYHEGDCVGEKKTTNKSNMEKLYQKGVLQANELHKDHKELRKKIQSQVKIAPPLKPPQYVKIRVNKAVGNVKIVEVDTSTISPCECNPNSDHPCSPDSECLNRILMVECDPNTCPAGEKCENQYFEKRIYPSLAPCFTDGRGWGLKILEDIPKGTFVIEYVGEVIDDEEYQKRLLKKHEEKDENYYFLTIDSTRIIDAGPKGNVSRFMNHSCQPNCETQKWTVMGDTRVGLFSLCDIPAGTELTFNYNLESKGNEKKPCMCGAPICSGFIGAKKNKAPLTDSKEPSSGKKKRRRPRVRNFIEDICMLCDAGKEVAALVSCINKECASKYHLACLGLASHPLGKWLCPRHQCNVCQKRTQQWCSYCTESYCPAHYEDNLVNDPLHGHICEVHQKNPLSKDHLKTKRDEQRKLMEEEKRKVDEEKKRQYEEERARRRSRRALISNEEETVDDSFSEGSALGDNDIPLDVKRDSTDEKVDDKEVSKGKNGQLRTYSKADNQPSSAKKTPKAKVASEIKDASPVPSRRGRKKKIVPVEDDSLHLTGESNTVALKKEPQSIEDDLKEIKMEPNSVEESQISSSHSNDAAKDDIPDADPTLDKFILAPLPMDDSPESFSKKKRKKSNSPKSIDNAPPNEASPSSVTKRKRKPPVHNMDYVNSQSLNLKRSYGDSTPDRPSSIKKLYPKKPKETNFDKNGLVDELEDIATGFASDDSQESPQIKFKKSGGKGRLSLNHVRSHTADSTTGDIPDTFSKDKNGPYVSPKKLKSPVTPATHLSPGSPVKLSAAKIFAMQRAKGLKVMPPNRRLSSAREQALGSRLSDEADERVERSGKGLKVMKGRRFSAESNAEDKKTENLHGESPQSGVSKKVRPVLSKVEDNAVSVEDDVEDKTLENGVLPPARHLQSHPMQSPPSKRIREASPKKSTIGVCSLWNQDILNIMK